jgi:hypothetical protein
VCRLVDRRFFAYAADSYIRAHPPAAPCLFEYGESFAEFLAAFPACRHLQYLPDVARLEWAMHRALHADDAAAADPALLAGLPAAQLGQTRLALHPSVSLLASSLPVDRIWRANQPDGDGGASLDAGGITLEVRRIGDEAAFRTLGAGEYALRSALLRGATLQHALEAARAAEPEADIGALIQRLFSDHLVVALHVPAPASDGARA